jgi:hypothetical protein
MTNSKQIAILAVAALFSVFSLIFLVGLLLYTGSPFPSTRNSSTARSILLYIEWVFLIIPIPVTVALLIKIATKK